MDETRRRRWKSNNNGKNSASNATILVVDTGIGVCLDFRGGWIRMHVFTRKALLSALSLFFPNEDACRVRRRPLVLFVDAICSYNISKGLSEVMKNS